MARQASVETYGSRRLRNVIGPAESQSGAAITVQVRNVSGVGTVACGTNGAPLVIVDNGPLDWAPAVNSVQARWIWNDLTNETNFRAQEDQGSQTFVVEDVGLNLGANVTEFQDGSAFVGPGVLDITFRVRASFAVGPNLVSNDCVVQLSVPGV